MLQNKVILGYWNIRGLAESIRVLLSYLKIDFEEVRYRKIPVEQGGADWFGRDKQSLGFEFPSLPYLIDGDKKLTQSQAILKYVCKIANQPDMLGKTIEDQIQLDVLLGVMEDVRFEMWSPFINENCDEEVLKKLFTEDPSYKFYSKMSQIDNYLKDKTYFVGYITYLDIFFYVNLVTYNALSEKLFGASFLEKLPNLKKYFFNIKELSEIKSYESDPNFNYLPFLPPTLKFQF